MAIERTKAELVDEFDGIMRKLEIVPDQMNEDQEQYHLEIEPSDKTLLADSKTGAFHVWLRITKKATTSSVPEGSTLDKYLQEVETVVKEARKANAIVDALSVLKGKKIHWVKKVLGKSFKGHEARPLFVPQAIVA